MLGEISVRTLLFQFECYYGDGIAKEGTLRTVYGIVTM